MHRGLGHIDATEHQIHLTPNAKPFHQPPYWAVQTTRIFIRRKIEKVRETGVVEPANTEWVSPVVFALK